jgi:archaellum component FlaC
MTVKRIGAIAFNEEPEDLKNTIETLKKEVEQLTHTVNAITQVNEDLSELVQVQRLTRPVYIQ